MNTARQRRGAPAAIPAELLEEARRQKQPLPSVSDGAAEAKKADDRGPAGHFAPGNKAGRGNPFARRLGAMRSAFLDAVTTDNVRAVALRLLELAKAGDLAAAHLLLAYAVGKPTKAVDLDRLDLDEFSLLNAAPTATECVRVLLDAIPPDKAAAVVGDSVERKPATLADVLNGVKDHTDMMHLVREQEARRGKNVGGKSIAQ